MISILIPIISNTEVRTTICNWFNHRLWKFLLPLGKYGIMSHLWNMRCSETYTIRYMKYRHSRAITHWTHAYCFWVMGWDILWTKDYCNQYWN